MARATTLSQAVLGPQTLLKQAGLVLGGSWLIALAAQLSVPMWPVPMTLQMLAILVIGLSFGPRLGAVTLLAYLGQGAAGLPVFAGGGGGLAYMAGPTGGFLIGFVLSAWIAGLAAGRGLWVMMATALIASAALYIPGTAWPFAVAGAMGVEGGWVGTSVSALWAGWVAPFLLGDAVKAVLAALIVSGVWAALKGRKA